MPAQTSCGSLTALRATWPLVVAAFAAVALVALDALGEDAASLGSALLQGGLNAMVLALAWRASRRLDGRLRTAWRIVAASSAAVLGTLVGVLVVVALGGPIPSEQGLLWLLVLVNGLAFAGLLLLSPPEIRGASALRFALDGLIVGTAILFMLMAAVEQWQPGAPGGDLTDLAYPAIDAASLTLVLLVVSRRRGHVPTWYILVAASFVLVLITDAATAARPSLPTTVTDSGYYLQLGLIATAARLAAPWPPPTESPERLATQWAVYVPFGLSIGAALYDFVEHDGLVAPLFFLAVLAVSLVVTRTILLLGENDRLARRLRETDAFKTQLLRFISHEVANPLSPLRLQAHLLRGGKAKDPAKAWSAVDRSIDRLEVLSHDVRLMALAETQRLVKDPKPGDLAPRIQGAVAAHQAVADQRGLRLVADISPATVPVDAERFDQVVDNLLSNALKFTPPGGTITVRLRPDHQGAVLAVEDTGAGLTEERRVRLFTAFGRAHGDTQPGLGLGLYLCKAIVDGHHGRISAESLGPGKGSAFRVELPFAPPAAGPPAPPPRPHYPPIPPAGTDEPAEAARPPDPPTP
jgi:signal transduction histidine kinase